MSLSSSQLDAFSEVVRTSSFSKAARNLAITQSALSQRIKNLEEELGTSLLVRNTSGLRLTPAGEEILRYSKNRLDLEGECLERLKSSTASPLLAGVIRVGGFSTVMRSAVLKALQPLLAKHTKLRMEMLTREMWELPRLLQAGEVDYLFLDHSLEKNGIESHIVGLEENVLVESSDVETREDVYLDHDSDDETTIRFFKLQNKKPKKFYRSYLDEIYGIIDGVALGLGRAIVPKHLIEKDQRIKIISGFKPLLSPVVLNYYHQPFYNQLQKSVIDCFTKFFPLRGTRSLG